MENKVTLALMDCNSVSSDMYDMAGRFVTDSRLTKVKRLMETKDRVLGVMGELILLYYLKTVYGVSVSEFSHGRYGKPYIAEKDGIKFNISHTRGLMGVAISGFEIGLDIENNLATSRDQMEQVSDFCFSDKEIRYIDFGLKGSDERFFEVWTRREAYYKWLGCGLSVRNNKKEISGPYHFFGMRYKNYTLNVCSGNEMNIELHLLNEQTLGEVLKNMSVH